MFSPQTYLSRRERLRKTIGSGMILLMGNEESPMNYSDNTYPFRQDSSFLYYFGLELPGLTSIMDVDEGKDILFGDDLSIDDIVWMGKQPTIKEHATGAGVTFIEGSGKLGDYLRRAMGNGRAVHYLPPYRPENKIKLFNLLDIHPDELAENASTELIIAVVGQREIKSEEEIAEIELAVNISADMHIEAIRMAKPGMLESEVAARIEEIALAANVRPAFPTIATINGQTLHNHYHGNIIKKGDLFLVDAGAESPMHYAGDLSSTFPVDTNFTELQKEIYRITLNAHMAAVSRLFPGNPFRDVHMTACREIFEGLKSLGLTKGDTADAVEQGAHALFFPCGTGHMMGLDVHDMEDLGETWVGYGGLPKSKLFGMKSLRLAKPLKPGFVLTIEPGIYFIPDLIELWKSENRFGEFLNYKEIEKYRTFGGIRNEEDFLITEQGHRLLGKPVPKTIEEVESLRD
ncbi:MAG: aminopeptidase P family protein [Bacteroidales bacterium]|nr:aminopeptidase P family protein [Bacteroidales bacterium]